MTKDKEKVIVCHAFKSNLSKEIEMNSDGLPVIDENQAYINKLLGIGDDVFFKYSRGLDSDDPAQREQAQNAIDAFNSAGDMVFAKYQNDPQKWPEIIDDCQRRINELMGISDEEFLAACKSTPAPDPSIDESQRKINEMMGVDDATFTKYYKERRHD